MDLTNTSATNAEVESQKEEFKAMKKRLEAEIKERKATMIRL